MSVITQNHACLLRAFGSTPNLGICKVKGTVLTLAFPQGTCFCFYQIENLYYLSPSLASYPNSPIPLSYSNSGTRRAVFESTYTVVFTSEEVSKLKEEQNAELSS